MTYYKAIRPDGTDFRTGTVQWAPAQGGPSTSGIVVTHPTSMAWEEDHATHLCASTSPTDCTGFSWPCRLLEVEPVSEVHRHAGSKCSALSWRVVRELPAVEAFGPQGAAVVALLDGLERLDATQLAARRAARDATQLAARRAAWDAAGDAAWDAVDAAWDAVDALIARDLIALIVWDLIAPDQRDALTAPIRTALPNVWADVSTHLPA